MSMHAGRELHILPRCACMSRVPLQQGFGHANLVEQPATTQRLSKVHILLHHILDFQLA
jgi:hypothetical protein